MPALSGQSEKAHEAFQIAPFIYFNQNRGRMQNWLVPNADCEILKSKQAKNHKL